MNRLWKTFWGVPLVENFLGCTLYGNASNGLFYDVFAEDFLGGGVDPFVGMCEWGERRVLEAVCRGPFRRPRTGVRRPAASTPGAWHCSRLPGSENGGRLQGVPFVTDRTE